MALPKIDSPVYELDLPLSKIHMRFRPFLVKEQRNLMMALESDDKDTIEKNIRQVLHNCTVTEGIDIEKLPILDIEYYFIQLRARSVGEIVESKYTCENEIDGVVCNNLMDTKLNLLEIQLDKSELKDDVVQLTDKISIKLKYPEFSALRTMSTENNAVDMAFNLVIDSVDYIFDGEQYYYSKETPRNEIIEFIESLSQQQFEKIENFFDELPKLNKKIEVDCSKCGFHHTIEVEGLENFFG